MVGDVQLEPGEDGREALAVALKAMRVRTGMTGVAFAKKLGWTQSKVTKTETGRTRPSLADVITWAKTAAATDAEVEELNRIAVRAAVHIASWRSMHAHGLTQRQIEAAAVEAATTNLRNFQSALVPGLLQTPEYARRVLTMMDISGRKDIASAVAARLNRQAVLFDDSKTFHFVITEAALRWKPGAGDVLHGQMDRLLNMMGQPNVTITVIPLGAEAVLPYLSGFTVFHIPNDPLVVVEVLSTELQFRTEEELSLYSWAFEQLATSGVAGSEASTIIRSVTS